MRGLCDTMGTFRDSSRLFGESIRKSIAKSLHPSEIGALLENYLNILASSQGAIVALWATCSNTHMNIRISILGLVAILIPKKLCNAKRGPN